MIKKLAIIMFMAGYVNIVQTVGNQRSASKVVKAASHFQIKKISRESRLAQINLVQSIRSNGPEDDIQGDIQIYVTAWGLEILKVKIQGKSILQIADQAGNYRAVDAIVNELNKIK